MTIIMGLDCVAYCFIITSSFKEEWAVGRFLDETDKDEGINNYRGLGWNPGLSKSGVKCFYRG
jgi:hypothetical protein